MPLILGALASALTWLASVVLSDFVKGLIKDFAKSVADAVWSEVKSFLWNHRGELTKAALSTIMGIDVQGELTPKSFTDAVNAKYGTTFSNIFNGNTLREDLERLALERIEADLGSPGIFTSLTNTDVRGALREYAWSEMKKVVAGEGSALFTADMKSRIIDAAKGIDLSRYEPQPERPLLMDKKSISNRARQAAYRQNHRRVWVAR